MKKKITLVLLIFLLSLHAAKEKKYSTEYKVALSPIILIGEVVSIKFGEIKKHNNVDIPSQKVEVKFKVSESLKGKIEDSIEIIMFSYSYTIKKDNGVIEGHDLSAGFDTRYIKKGNKYLAYVQKKNGNYLLCIGSSQFFESITNKNDKKLKEELKEILERRKGNQKTD